MEIPSHLVEIMKQTNFFERLKRLGKVELKVEIPIDFDSVGCRSCNWVGDIKDCIIGEYTQNSLSCPKCGAFCGEMCKGEIK